MFSWKRLPIWLGLQEKPLLKCGPQPRWTAEGNSSRAGNLAPTLSLVFYWPIDGWCSKSQPKQKTITRLPPTNNQPQYIPRRFRARWLASSEIISKYQYLFKQRDCVEGKFWLPTQTPNVLLRATCMRFAPKNIVVKIILYYLYYYFVISKYYLTVSINASTTIHHNVGG